MHQIISVFLMSVTLCNPTTLQGCMCIACKLYMEIILCICYSMYMILMIIAFVVIFNLLIFTSLLFKTYFKFIKLSVKI